MKFIYKETNYYQHLTQHYYYDHLTRWKNLGELVTIAGSKKEMGGYEDEEPKEFSTATPIEEPSLLTEKELVLCFAIQIFLLLKTKYTT